MRKSHALAATLALALLAAGLFVAAAASGAATDPSGCVLHQGNHCKRAAATSTTDPTTTTTGATTTDATTTEPTTTDVTTTEPTTTTPAGVVDQTEEWKCPGTVNLQLVKVDIEPTSKSTDAVQLTNDCSGYIGEIDVTEWKGDGIHVNWANNLVVGKVVIRCYQHVPLKHQDGIQVLGGANVTFENLDVGCYSANNSQVWINQGAGGNGPGGVPTNVIFDGGRFQGYFNNGQYGPGGSYGVSIGDSVGTGFRNVTVCPNAHTARQVNVLSSAVNPVLDNVTKAASC